MSLDTKNNNQLDTSKLDSLIKKMNVLEDLKNNSQKGYPIIEFTPEGYITYIKNSFVSEAGYKKGDFEGKHFSDFANPKEPNNAIRPEVWNKVLHGKIISIDFTIYTRNGENKSVKAYLEGIQNSKGIVFKILLKATKW